MKSFKGIFWLALFASALFFGGCIKNDGEAFEAPPDLSAANTDYVDSFSTYLETYRFDSLATTSREYAFAGSYTDGILGSLSTEGYFQFLPESYPLVCPDPDTILDEYTKATISLQYDDVYGTFGTDQFGLYRLTENLSGDKTYYATDPPPATETNPYLTTANASRENKVIRLDANDLGREIISKWKEFKSFSNDQQFLSVWKGFAIRSLGTVSQVTRFDLRYSNAVPSAFLEVSYRVKGDSGTASSLKTLKFRTNNTTVQYYRFNANYQGTPWQSIPAKGGLPSVMSNEKAAVQGLGGLATKVGIPGLLSWKAKQTKKIKVFKAELEVKPDDGGSLPVPEFLKISSRKDYYNPNERDFSTVVFNDEEIFSLLQQGISSREAAKTQSIAQVFSYTTTSNVYKCNITTYIQDVMDGKSTSPFFNLYSAQWGTTVNRMLLSKGSVKLKIYYYPI